MTPDKVIKQIIEVVFYVVEAFFKFLGVGQNCFGIIRLRPVGWGHVLFDPRPEF